ncbi:MAG: MerR family transcriptional regulator [Chitinophagia bacterium]|nr:MerR family transcriptional regulator [Chitinophagia bacterium]
MAKKPLTQIQLDFDTPPPVTVTNSISVEPVESSHVVSEEPHAAPAKPHVVSEDPHAAPEEPLIGIRRVKLKENLATKPGKRGRRSLKDIASRVDLIQVPEDEELFKKQYYSIGEVAAMFREKQSLIRYWETEFDILQPRKNRKGDRYFRPIDVKNLVLIYDLLRRRKFTIDGARDFLKKNKKAEDRFSLIQSLQKIRGFLVELRSNL